MNWFTKKGMSAASIEAKKISIATWGGCDHVLADPAVLVEVSYENDSFGREGFCLCRACVEKAEEETNAEVVVCTDCKQEFKRIDTIEWKWYDFLASQGDEALCVCKECKGKPAHQRRVKQDRDNELDEFPET